MTAREASLHAEARVREFAERVGSIRRSLHEVVVGQDATIDLLLTCCLTGSHALIVGVPGLAKTLMVRALASAFHWKFARVQFTPDLMPSASAASPRNSSTTARCAGPNAAVVVEGTVVPLRLLLYNLLLHHAEDCRLVRLGRRRLSVTTWQELLATP